RLGRELRSADLQLSVSISYSVIRGNRRSVRPGASLVARGAKSDRQHGAGSRVVARHCVVDLLRIAAQTLVRGTAGYTAALLLFLVMFFFSEGISCFFWRACQVRRAHSRNDGGGNGARNAGIASAAACIAWHPGFFRTWAGAGEQSDVKRSWDPESE